MKSPKCPGQTRRTKKSSEREHKGGTSRGEVWNARLLPLAKHGIKNVSRSSYKHPVFIYTETNDLLHLKEEIALWPQGFVRMKDRFGRTPFFIACEMGHYKVAKWLFEAGSSLHVRAYAWQCTPLMVAIFEHRYDVVEWLLHLDPPLDDLALRVCDERAKRCILDHQETKQAVLLNQLLRILQEEISSFDQSLCALIGQYLKQSPMAFPEHTTLAFHLAETIGKSSIFDDEF